MQKVMVDNDTKRLVNFLRSRRYDQVPTAAEVKKVMKETEGLDDRDQYREAAKLLMKKWGPPPAENKYFQIAFVDRTGCGSFRYFLSTIKKMHKEAEVTANEELRDNIDKEYRMFQAPFKPIRTVRVAEYDCDKSNIKRGGIKFFLTLSYCEFTFASGSKIRSEWYRVIE